jgi:RIO kinase 1
MRLPRPLMGLIEDGIIDEVLRPLQSGKEAQVFLVMVNGEVRVAKVYKETTNRSFKHRAEYTEGRKVRNSRDQRAIEKRTKFGRGVIENEWSQCEVDMLQRLHDAGVRVPEMYDFVDNVLVMELIKDAKGNPAPRLVDLMFSPKDAEALLKILVQEVVRMLCAGVVHGDLSDFNILMSADGPVIIDLPQAIDTSQNRNARKLLLRDVSNLKHFFARYSRNLLRLKYGPEMWDLYEKGKLEPNTVLTGVFHVSKKKVDSEAILREIQAAAREEAARQESVGISKYAARRAKRAEEVAQSLAESSKRKADSSKRNATSKGHAQGDKKPGAGGDSAEKGRRPRRRRRRR